MNRCQREIIVMLVGLLFSSALMAAPMGPGMMNDDDYRANQTQRWGGPGYGYGYGYGGMMGPGMMGPGYGYGGMGPGMMGPGYGYGYGGMGPGMMGQGYGYGGMMGPGMMGQGYGYGGMMGPGMMGGYGYGGMNLNDSQRKKLYDNMAAMQKKHWGYMEQMSDASNQLAELYNQTPLDAKKIKAAYQKIFDVRLQMIDDMVKTQNDFYSSLTDEQRKELKEYGRGYPGGGMMR